MTQTIEQVLASQGHGFFQTVGDSMAPLLQNRKSTVVIQAKNGRLKRYDVALYRRPAGEYVLHRVIRVLRSGYLVCGDNRTDLERVPEEWVLGRMTGYFPDEHSPYVSCTDPSAALYLKRLKQSHRKRWLRKLRLRLRRALFP